MLAIRVASAALLGVGALALSAPAAVAHGDGHGHHITPFGFSVVPSTVAAGGQVTLQVNRDRNCRGPVTVTSPVFDTATIRTGHSAALRTVDWDARPGAVYRVTFTCDGVRGSTDLTIAGRRPDHHKPLPFNPHHGVQAGAGGSVAGFDLKELGMGALLIAGSLGAAYHFARRGSGEDAA